MFIDDNVKTFYIAWVLSKKNPLIIWNFLENAKLSNKEVDAYWDKILSLASNFETFNQLCTGYINSKEISIGRDPSERWYAALDAFQNGPNFTVENIKIWLEALSNHSDRTSIDLFILLFVRGYIRHSEQLIEQLPQEILDTARKFLVSSLNTGILWRSQRLSRVNLLVAIAGKCGISTTELDQYVPSRKDQDDFRPGSLPMAILGSKTLPFEWIENYAKNLIKTSKKKSDMDNGQECQIIEALLRNPQISDTAQEHYFKQLEELNYGRQSGQISELLRDQKFSISQRLIDYILQSPRNNNRLHLASRIGLPSWVYEAIYHRGGISNELTKLAGNEDLPKGVLRELIDKEDLTLIRLICGRSDYLSLDKDMRDKIDTLQKKWFTLKDNILSLDVLKMRHVPSEIITKAIESDVPAIRKGGIEALFREGFDWAVTKQICIDFIENIDSTSVGNFFATKYITFPIIQEIWPLLSVDNRIALTRNTLLDPESYIFLQKFKLCRAALAENPMLPSKVYNSFSKIKLEPAVFVALAKNPSVPVEILAKLKDKITGLTPEDLMSVLPKEGKRIMRYESTISKLSQVETTMLLSLLEAGNVSFDDAVNLTILANGVVQSDPKARVSRLGEAVGAQVD
jgi:hypothetical protein